MRCRVLCFLLAVSLACWASMPAASETERIELFEVSVRIGEDASLTVTESITVFAAGDQVRRGIVRVFPTDYRDSDGNLTRAGFELIEATLNGAPTPAEVQRFGPEVEIRLGDPDILLDKGSHLFVITYRTTGQVAFLGEHDELYWNATGDAWAFPIERARFELALPARNPGDAFTEIQWYTGRAGDTGRDARRLEDNAVETTRSLDPGEGLTVVYAWPKGILDPGAAIAPESIGRWQMSPFRRVLLGLALGLFVYYLGAWALIGHDPPVRNLIPRFAPPEGIDAGFLRYLTAMRLDDQAFAAAILGLAVKGVLTIEERRLTADAIPGLDEASPLAGKAMALMGKFFGSEYTLHLRREELDAAGLNSREQLLVKGLFGDSRNELRLDTANRKVLLDCWKALKTTYENDGRPYFTHNLAWWLGGAIAYGVTAASLFAMALWRQGQGDALWLDAMLAVAAPAFLLLPILIPVTKGSGGFFAMALFKGLFPGMFVLVSAGFVWAGSGSDHAVDPLACLAPFVAAILVAVFRKLLPVRTQRGAELRDEANGLRMYIETGESARLAALTPPDRTPEHFEELLPYACALGTAGTWADRFEEVLAAKDYTPRWHTGRRTPIYAAGQMPSLVSGMSRSLGSSRGGSGLKGGSAGGGRGGGGGRGW